MEGAARLHQFSDTAQTLPCLLLDTVQSTGESNAVGPHTLLRTEHQLLHWGLTPIPGFSRCMCAGSQVKGGSGSGPREKSCRFLLPVLRPIECFPHCQSDRGSKRILSKFFFEKQSIMSGFRLDMEPVLNWIMVC